MSTNSNSSRDAFNAGSDSRHRFGTSVADAFAKATATPAPTEQGTPTVRDLKIQPTTTGAVKNRGEAP